MEQFGELQVQLLGDQVQLHAAGEGVQQLIWQPLHPFGKHPINIVVQAGHPGRGVAVGQPDFDAGVLSGKARERHMGGVARPQPTGAS